MSKLAKIVNSGYLDQMRKASKSPVTLVRIRELWWKAFESEFEKDPVFTIDNLDLYMDQGKHKLKEMAKKYSQSKGHLEGSENYVQRVNQFLKSNTGKMFERFTGLAIAHYLKKMDSNYCIWPYRNDLKKVSSYLRVENFTVIASLGDNRFMIPIDCDLIIFNPLNPNDDFYMVSVKSTLKDRFHNVPFWNLVRLAALKNTPSNLIAERTEYLKKAKYIVICSDLAEEQPDFSSSSGPRNLISFDAALLDGAYVTASRAKGLGNDKNHLGINRTHPFYPLSTFIEYLLKH